MTDREKKAEELLREVLDQATQSWMDERMSPEVFRRARAFLATPREPKKTEDRMTMSIRIMDAEWCLKCRAPMLQLSREERPDVYDGPCRCEPLAPAEPQEERLPRFEGWSRNAFIRLIVKLESAREADHAAGWDNAIHEAEALARSYRRLWGSTVEGSQDPGTAIADAIAALKKTAHPRAETEGKE